MYTKLELDEVVTAARRRALGLYGIVVAIIAGISSRIRFAGASSTMIADIVVWFTLSTMILIAGGLWVRWRFKSAQRFRELLEAGTLKVQEVDVTRVRLKLVPFGVEVDLVLGSGERLPLGFWREADVETVRGMVGATTDGRWPA